MDFSNHFLFHKTQLYEINPRFKNIAWSYDSPVSFSRAFRELHGVTPTEARAGGVTLKAYPRISFQITVKGEKEMDYRIESKETFSVFGVEGVFSNEGAYPDNPQGLWNKNHANGAYERLAADAGDLPPFVGQELCRVHGICDYRKTEPGTFPYMQCAFRSGSSRAAGYTAAEIPAYTWAIFPSERFTWDKVGKVFNELYKRFVSEWLPTAEYERADDMNLEVYGGDRELGYAELWFPVRKKA